MENHYLSEEWLEFFREIIRAYHKDRKPDPFLGWYNEKVQTYELRNLFERIMTILVDARFDQKTTAEEALENTKRIHQAGLIRVEQLRLEEVPLLIPRENFTSEGWKYSFYTAHNKLVELTFDITNQRSWLADLLVQRVRVVPYLGAKTSRLAVRWLYELIPELNIDMRSYPIPIDDNLYRVAARLGILDPYVHKYNSGIGGGLGDEKIQRLAQRAFPEHPYLIDEPLWFTGRSKMRGGYCYRLNPNHDGCLFETICTKNYLKIDPSKIGIN